MTKEEKEKITLLQEVSYQIGKLIGVIENKIVRLEIEIKYNKITKSKEYKENKQELENLKAELKEYNTKLEKARFELKQTLYRD